ncbi:MAG: hypothetical protein M0R17_03020 [Candidatus Omnitrophica bacterium]|jgi:hypothetical protein|nr:hypothetical protein [Candidatus Omnitrophota bacterium]
MNKDCVTCISQKFCYQYKDNIKYNSHVCKFRRGLEKSISEFKPKLIYNKTEKIYEFERKENRKHTINLRKD